MTSMATRARVSSDTLDDALACVGGYTIFNDGTLRG